MQNRETDGHTKLTNMQMTGTIPCPGTLFNIINSSDRVKVTPFSLIS